MLCVDYIKSNSLYIKQFIIIVCVHSTLPQMYVTKRFIIPLLEYPYIKVIR